MNIIGYSDSESDNDTPPAQPVAKTKPAFQKVVDRAAPGKIKLNLPQPKAQQDDGADDRPAKKPRLGGEGAFGGFSSMLPAPKRANATLQSVANEEGIPAGSRGLGKKLGVAVNLKNGSEPAFKREPKIINRDETSTSKDNDAFRSSLNLPPSKNKTDTPLPGTVEETANPDPKPVKRFLPLSISRNQRKKKRPLARPDAEVVPLPSTEPAAEAQPAPKPRISLFSLAQDEQTQPAVGAARGEYQPMLYGQDDDDDDNAQVPDEAFDNSVAYQAPPPTMAPQPARQNLDDLASELNLTAADRRRLFGRKGFDPATANILEFNTDQEYAHNEKLRAAGEAVEHRALKSISGTGKNSLKSLVNVSVTQRDALEEHWAQGRRNKKEAGSKYGW
ncbi:hypothetical protein EJ04DRAFT_511376 [Polyplosphaeria fusca]|uniref:Mitotic checkpoint regulator, MAD2B-interacting-domain-containing protein n=1 Tax=Polyplosphaeria fusca TaxID=682080 RepID=A0A9P4R3B4_9PLEO|nr:hypothetical protein EJ04DRAFT_511376 [Polyplosphaeria fusca]